MSLDFIQLSVANQMSTGTQTPPPAIPAATLALSPQMKSATDFIAKLALAAIVAWNAHAYTVTPATPTIPPVTPSTVLSPAVPLPNIPAVVTPPVIPNTPVHEDAVVVQPRVVITTQLTPTPVPSLVVSLVDGQGNKFAGSIDAGKLWVASSPEGTELTPIASNPDDADIDQTSGNRFTAVLRNGCKVQIVATGMGKPIIVSVACNQAPQPPPIVTPVIPTVVPPVVPSVNPTVTVEQNSNSATRVLILYDPIAKYKSDQIAARDSTKVRDLLNEKVGATNWHCWSTRLSTSKQTADWQAFMQASLGAINAKSLATPVLCVEKGTHITFYSIDSESGELATLNQIFGS